MPKNDYDWAQLKLIKKRLNLILIIPFKIKKTEIWY